MHNIFKSDTISLIAARDIDTYGQLVVMNRKLAQRGFQKTLQRCFTYKFDVEKGSMINGYSFDSNCVTHWLGYALHNENGPAYISDDGTKEWWLNGKLHREDEPAVIYSDGTNEWWLNGKLHREDGPAIICINSYKAWYLNGEYQPNN